MKKYLLPALIVCIALGFLVLFSGVDTTFLDPKGTIADQQRDLLYLSVLLMLIVVVPVYLLIFFIVWRYREGNTKAKYDPHWAHDNALEFAWWAIPCVIIAILAWVTWQTSHSLDPYRPIESDVRPVKIQVVALDWKWLFIYPEEGIATINYVRFPEQTPIEFSITADAPMNAFWIPDLGGQIYAMTGMASKLHLMANGVDTYQGLSSNFSGRGFSNMRFTAESSSRADFDEWVRATKESASILDWRAYQRLAEPTENNSVVYYGKTDPEIFNRILMQFVGHVGSDPSGSVNSMEGMMMH